MEQPLQLRHQSLLPALGRMDGAPGHETPLDGSKDSALYFCSDSDDTSRSPRSGPSCRDVHPVPLVGMGQMCNAMLDVTQDTGLAKPAQPSQLPNYRGSQDLGLAHSPTFFGCLHEERQAPQQKASGDGGQRSPRCPPSGNSQRSPCANVANFNLQAGGDRQRHQSEENRTHRQPEEAPKLGRASRWKSEDIAKLEDELAQLRCAATEFDHLSVDSQDRQTQSSARNSVVRQDSGSSAGRSGDSARLLEAARAVTIAHGRPSESVWMMEHGRAVPSVQSLPASACASVAQSPQPFMAREGMGPRVTVPPMPQSLVRPARSGEPSEVMSVRSGDSPVGSEISTAGPSVQTNPDGAQTQLREALMEVERLKLALQKAHAEIDTLREESKASDAAHSRDVATLASLLQQVTAEKAKVLSDAVKYGKIDKTGSSTTTADDSCSVAASEPDSEGALGHHISGALGR